MIWLKAIFLTGMVLLVTLGVFHLIVVYPAIAVPIGIGLLAVATIGILAILVLAIKEALE